MANPIYSKAPLIETIFEIRFPGNPSVECHRDEVYQEFQESFPVVNVPIKIPPGSSLATAPYQFQSEDGKNTIMISINALAYSTKSYEGFDRFKKQTMQLINFFGKRFGIKNLKRTGLRYINVIPFTRESGAIPVSRFLNMSVSLPQSVPNAFKDFTLVFNSIMKSGLLTTRIDSATDKSNSTEALVVDFDYAREKEIPFNSIDKCMDESHHETKVFFEELITKEYKNVMMGEVIE